MIRDARRRKELREGGMRRLASRLKKTMSRARGMAISDGHFFSSVVRSMRDELIRYYQPKKRGKRWTTEFVPEDVPSPMLLDTMEEVWTWVANRGDNKMAAKANTVRRNLLAARKRLKKMKADGIADMRWEDEVWVPFVDLIMNSAWNDALGESETSLRESRDLRESGDFMSDILRNVEVEGDSDVVDLIDTLFSSRANSDLEFFLDEYFEHIDEDYEWYDSILEMRRVCEEAATFLMDRDGSSEEDDDLGSAFNNVAEALDNLHNESEPYYRLRHDTNSSEYFDMMDELEDVDDEDEANAIIDETQQGYARDIVPYLRKAERAAKSLKKEAKSWIGWER